jgi:RHS repeat-associated protein
MRAPFRPFGPTLVDHVIIHESKAMADQPKIAAPQIALPKGGGAIRSIGETFQPDAFTGTTHFSVPIPTTPCRDFEPALSVDYSSTGGNGPFGIGFALQLPAISRKTSDGVPRYDTSDHFIFVDGQQLVPESASQQGPAGRQVSQDGAAWTVVRYRPRLEREFDSIEHWIDGTTRLSYWKVCDKRNVTSIYGRSSAARIADPNDPTHIFQWLVEEEYDSYGNVRAYSYKQENLENVPNQIFEQNRSVSANRYLHAVRYGNTVIDAATDPAQEQFFEIVFDYGEYDLNNPDAPPGAWAARSDPFSSYNAGFEIRTHRLCRAALVFHRFGASRFAVRALRFTYHETSALSFLQSIQLIGYRQQTAGVYTTAVMPPLEFGYTAFDPTAQTFKPLQISDGAAIPGVLDRTPYLLVDLHGEGLPGVLYSDQRSTLYFAPAGGGVYEYPAALARFPIERDLSNSSPTLIDLDGNGQLDLLVRSPTRSGYYQSALDGAWQPYASFETYPNELSDPRGTLIDLDGNGRIDLVFFSDTDVRLYPSRGAQGFGPPLSAPRSPQFPTTADPGAAEFVGFADIFGDGMQHWVRIRSGSVECWPNLGFGRFGARVLLGNAPQFGGAFDPSRLLLADIDGSGPADLAYIYRDRVEIFLNHSGNAFSTQPIVISLPQPYGPLDQISFADVLGVGATSLIFTKAAPETASYYYDFTGGVKPYLLTTTDNKLGALTSISYCSSTAYYLADKQAGQPWITVLPFPVHVVSRIESIDQLAGSKLVTCYTYHHGYYDPIEREFRGFGLVEQQESESFEQFTQPGSLDLAFTAPSAATFAPPRLTKSWYHTGAYVQANVLSRQYAHEYYHGDPAAYRMPDSALDPAIDRDDATTIREAYAALAGQLLREEIYGLDSDLSANPYTVREHNVTVRLEQPHSGRQPAVFFVHPRETINYIYERDPHDPRAEHSFTLAVDPFGHVTRSCDVFYPRRSAQLTPISPAEQRYPEQEQLKVNLTLSQPINLTTSCRWLGLPADDRRYELAGLDLAEQPYFSFAQIDAQVQAALAHPLRYDQPFTPGTPQARLFEWSRTLYWNEAQTAPLPLGEISCRALEHHTERAALTPELLTNVFGERVTPGMISDDGGYVLSDGYWWDQGAIQVYYATAAQFYLPAATSSALGDRATFTYDPFWQVPAAVTTYLSDTISNTISAEIDYHTMQPRQTTDCNNVISQALFDPLGLVIATSLFKVEADGAITGDGDLSQYTVRADATLDDLLARPAYYIQQAGSFFFYDVLHWQEQQQPAFFVSLVRERYASESQSQTDDPFQITIAYSDGFGRTLETKRTFGACDDALLRTPAGALRYAAERTILRGAAETCWIVSGRTVYNNQGLPVEQYQPYFSTSPQYEDQAEVTENGGVPPPTILFYDALERQIQTQTPKGFLTRVVFASWVERHFDEDDTVLESPYYQTHYHDAPPDEKDALDKAAVFADTPLSKALDPLGRVFLSIAINVQSPSPSGRAAERSYLLTRTTLDAQDNELTIADPRLGPQGLVNLTQVFDMQSNLLSSNSVDAGLRLQLWNIFDQQTHSWDGRGFHCAISYDRLLRPVSTYVKGDDQHGLALDQIVERVEYGETQPDAQHANLRGQVYKHYDQAGIITFERYSLLGSPERTVRQLLQDYQHEANWTDPLAPLLEPERYLTENRYNALNLLTSQQTPDNSRFDLSYNLVSLLTRVDLTYADQTRQTIVKAIDYEANLQRTRIHYGNDAISTYAYEQTTARIAQITTTRPPDPNAPTRPTQLQQIVYTYDPIGNVTRTRDYSPQTLFCDQADIDPLLDYTYDALYRLIRATGRQHPGMLCDTHIYGFKQSLYLPLCQPPSVNDLQKLQQYLESYTYDDSGNLTALQHTSPSSGPSWTQRIAIAADSNRGVPQACLPPASAGDPAPFPPTAYDADGNMLNLENLRAIGWNYRNAIARADIILREHGSSDSDYFVYDGAGLRIRKVSERYVNGGALTEIRETVYLDNLVLYRIRQQPAAGAATTILERQMLQVIADDERVALINSWPVDRYRREAGASGARTYRYQLNTLAGSSAVEIDQQASLISYEEFFPYGGSALIAGNDQREVALKDFRYSGEECDDSTGLYYYGARYYAPWLGRWTSPDPSGLTDGVNLYAFVTNNPTSFIDIGGAGRCSLCGKQGHNRNNKKFHPPGVGKFVIPLLKSIDVHKKHKRKLQGGKVVKTYLKKSKHGGTNVYLYVNEGQLKTKYSNPTADFFLQELAAKYSAANKLISSGAEKAVIGSKIHEGTSSQQFAKAQWQATHGNTTNIPTNPSGTVDIRGVAQSLRPIPTTLLDHHGAPLKQDVDERVSRDLGGSGSHSNSVLNPAVLGQNQAFMASLANSLAGAGDTAITADAKKNGFNNTNVRQFKLRRTSSFSNI